MSQPLEKALWAKLFRLIASTAASVTAAAFGGPVAGTLSGSITDIILGELLRLHTEETSLLQSIDQNVTALLHGPYNTGMIHLTDAKKPHRSEEDRQKCIEYARRAFVEAHGQEQEAQDYLRLAIIQYHIATCWFLLNHIEDARDWFKDAYITASRDLERWYETSNAKAQKDMSIAGGVTAATGVLGVAALPALPILALPAVLMGGWTLKNSTEIRQKAIKMGKSAVEAAMNTYVSLNPETMGKGKSIYSFIASLKQLEGNSTLDLDLPPLSPSLYKGIFNINQREE